MIRPLVCSWSGWRHLVALPHLPPSALQSRDFTHPGQLEADKRRRREFLKRQRRRQGKVQLNHIRDIYEELNWEVRPEDYLSVFTIQLSDPTTVHVLSQPDAEPCRAGPCSQLEHRCRPGRPGVWLQTKAARYIAYLRYDPSRV